MVYAIGKDDFSTLPLCFKKDVSETSFNVLFFAVKKNLLEVLKWTNENWAFPEINCTTLVKGIILNLTTPPPGIFKCFALQILANYFYSPFILNFKLISSTEGGGYISFLEKPRLLKSYWLTSYRVFLLVWLVKNLSLSVINRKLI